MSGRPEPFTLRVADEAIADPCLLLARTRFPDRAPSEPRAYNADLGHVRGLVAYWRDRFDRQQTGALREVRCREGRSRRVG